MTVRVGESWRTRNGHRRWISMPLWMLVLFVAFTWPWWAVYYGTKLAIVLGYLLYRLTRSTAVGCHRSYLAIRNRNF